MSFFNDARGRGGLAYPGSYNQSTAPIESTGPRAKCDQVVFEAIAKAAEIIVTSRCAAAAPASAVASSRFNLQVPELASVRTILQRSRRALHVPLRLDVYYQHDAETDSTDAGGNRELLERWCLEYIPVGIERFLEKEGTVTQDPIVQLRHVCKRIVIWLRTLCCASRLLPAQAFQQQQQSYNKNTVSPIGFSLYVVSNGTDDVTDLVHRQGFLFQQQPSSVVSPYGELGWRVVYARSELVDQLLGRNNKKLPVSASIPIRPSTNNHYRIQQQQQQQHRTARQDAVLTQQTAPAHLATNPNHWKQQHSDQSNKQLSSRVAVSPLPGIAQQVPVSRQTYDPSRFYHPPARPTSSDQLKTHSSLQRRHTTIGNADLVAPKLSQQNILNAENPQRVLSGLSLAMMSDEVDKEASSNPLLTPNTEVGMAPEKRRAVLHQLPPHLLDQQQECNQRPTEQGEYGYGYNNHIPWQKIHPSSTKPIADASGGQPHLRRLSSSPSALPLVLGNTPPSAAFLSGAGGILSSPTSANSPRLAPPRAAVLPPFQTRSTGFDHDAPTLHPSQTSEPQQSYAATAAAYEDVLPPLTSLDLLHSSPFQFKSQSSLVSSGGGGLCSLLHSGAGADLRRLMTGQGGSASACMMSNSLLVSYTPDDDYDEMPFAVELDEPATITASATKGISDTSPSSILGASTSASVVASFAQKLKIAPSNRLKLFESQASIAAATSCMADEKKLSGGNELYQQQKQKQQQVDLLVSNLAEQLAEFRSFGASLSLPVPTEEQATVGRTDSSKSTSIPLQT